MNNDNYFIKDGYICNPVKTFDKEGADKYWTKKRLEASKLFQYHVYEYAYKIFRKCNMQTLADVGSGPGIKTIDFFYEDSKHITLFDQPSTENIIEKKSEKVEFIPINLDNFSNIDINTQYDLIICADVIEHLGNPDCLLEFLKTIAHPESVIIISTPERDMRRGISNNHSPNKEHVREWNRKELFSYIRSKGFNVEKHFTTSMKKKNLAKLLNYGLLNRVYNPKHLNETQVITCKLR